MLPQAPDESNEYAKLGSHVHDLLERRDQVLDDQLGEHGTSIDELWPPGGLHEVLVWYDPVTRDSGYRPKGAGKHRDYSGFPDTTLVGTIDHVNPTLGTCDDLKTGYTPPPPDTLQLGLASVALAKGAGLTKVHASITHIRGGRERPKRAEVTHSEAELLGIRKRLDGLYAAHLLNRARVDAGTEPEYNPGRRCRYCRAKPSCPKAV